MRRSLATVGLVFGCVASAQAGYTGLYVFGDSLSDSGNDLVITHGGVPTPGIYTDATNTVTGRFTNGLNYADLLAADLGVSLTPSLLGGTNYAYGGARTAYIRSDIAALGGLSFNQQVKAYSNGLNTNHALADPNALYSLWIGANDMADAVAQTASNPAANQNTIQNAIQAAMLGIGDAIFGLAQLGAQHFLLPNLPNLALTPVVRSLNSAGLSALAELASTSFNTALANTLLAFSSLDLRTLNVFAAQTDMTVHPGAYGLSNVSSGCYTGEVDGSSRLAGGPAPTVCADPGEYLYWDYEHPTAVVHAELARLAFAAVPEPASWVLILAGLGLATFMSRRRRH